MSLLARTIGVWGWRWPARTARRLVRFALAEEGSMIDLRVAARLTPSATRAARYLAHAADEERHARMFASEARRWAERARVPWAGASHADVEDLFEALGERDFLAFVHRGERRGHAQFTAYRDHFAARGETRMVALFDAVLADEARHASDAHAMLLEVAGGEAEARRALRRMALWEAWRTWLRVGRGTSQALHALSMVVLYLLAAPLALLLRPRRERLEAGRG